MAEALTVGLIVVVAAGWVAWSLALPKTVRARLGARLTGPSPKRGCGEDCGCG